MRKLLVLPVLIVVLAAAPPLLAQEEAPKKAPPLPAEPVRAHDFPNDQGNKIRVVWLSSIDDPDPKLPELPLDGDPAPNAKSPQEEVEQGVERDRFDWYPELRRPVEEMLKIRQLVAGEEGVILDATFRYYLAEIVAKHLRNPLELADVLEDPAAWLEKFTGRLGVTAEESELTDLLTERMRDKEGLRRAYEQGETEYLDLVQRVKRLIPTLIDPERLHEELLGSQGLRDAVQTLMDASDLSVDREIFRDVYTVARAAVEVEKRQREARETLGSEFQRILESGEARQKVASYLVERADSPDGPWRTIGKKNFGATEFEDGGRGLEDGIEKGKAYFYRVIAVGDEGGRSVSAVASAAAKTQWWHHGRTNNFFAVTIFIALIVGWIWAAGKRLPIGGILVFSAFTLMLGGFAWAGSGTPVNIATLGCLVGPLIAFAVVEVGRRAEEIYIRPIAGIQAVDEAIGRATEMGKPILFVPGLSTIEDIATLAALNILGPVAEKAAEYDSKIIVPNRDPVVYTIAQEIVKESYLRAGRPDSFDAGSIYFVTGRQFAYAAAVNGLMLREKPATNFFLGMFWAESLLLAETGNMTGAIQIAGTDAVTQIPFFIVACDYTLIGEELYAAGAYMGRDPKLLGGLKGQDYNKAIVLAALILFALIFFALDLFQARSGLANGLRDLFERLFEVKN